ncbi:CsbD family protein [Corynebacterium freiburgense]|uniref:CsbD family protein n=1 Tax=Corynebacterium freiburgense TaxID=556548 RepID=UPI00040CC659|nr:CsbD family protein [Corynebacterium freiburgense]WJZ01414.1 CsbD-like protein [Corynebacterium freiburgense]
MGDLGSKAEKFGGKAKEAVGEAVGNESMADEGRADQTKADVKETLSNAGEAVQNAKDKVLGAFQKDDK